MQHLRTVYLWAHLCDTSRECFLQFCKFLLNYGINTSQVVGKDLVNRTTGYLQNRVYSEFSWQLQCPRPYNYMQVSALNVIYIWNWRIVYNYKVHAFWIFAWMVYVIILSIIMCCHSLRSEVLLIYYRLKNYVHVNK